MKAVYLMAALISLPALAEIKPEWASLMRAPKTNSSIFSVGFAESEDLNEAMSASWSSALANAVRTNLVEVLTLGEVSKESLKSSDYSRVAGLDLDRISPVGISESDKSPYIENISGKYKVWRLLEWSKSGIENTKKTIKSEQSAIENRKQELEVVNSGYVSKANIAISRNTLEKAKQALTALNKNNTYKDKLQLTKTVLMQLECGVTLPALEDVLGKGIRSNNPYDSQYFQFNNYKVVVGDSGIIYMITDLDGRLIRDVCQ